MPDPLEGTMLLVIEVGNTNPGLGVFDGQRLLVSWRLASRREQTADEYGVFIQTLLASQGIDRGRTPAGAIPTVAPPVQQTLEWMCEKYFGVRPFSVEPGVNVKLPMRVDNPPEVGADRLCNAVAPGGLATLIQGVARSIQHVNPDLRLEGLRLIWEQAHPQGP